APVARDPRRQPRRMPQHPPMHTPAHHGMRTDGDRRADREHQPLHRDPPDHTGGCLTYLAPPWLTPGRGLFLFAPPARAYRPTATIARTAAVSILIAWRSSPRSRGLPPGSSTPPPTRRPCRRKAWSR